MKTQIHPLLHDLLAGLLSGLVALTPATAAESVPPLINYQGSLTDANGAPMAGVKTMEFNLYDAPTGGNLIWGPQIYATVPLIGGKFNVLLGPTDSGGNLITTAFSDKTRYLSITLEGKEILPRQQVLSTPFAMKAQEATHAVNADVALNGVPIGSLIAWTNHLSNTPALPFGWAPCDGRMVTDSASPFNGQRLPNLNGEGRFLRGGNGSGIMQDHDFKSFSVESVNGPPYQHAPMYIPKNGAWSEFIYGGSWGVGPINKLRFVWDQSEVRPTNMTVVWIMKIK